MANVMKTVKIPEEGFEKVVEARKLLALQGINKLGQEERKVVEKEFQDFEKLTMGIIIGIGATLLIQALSR